MKPSVVAAAALVLSGAGILVLSNRSAQSNSTLILRSREEYTEANERAAKLSLPIFQKSQNGQPITESEKDALRRAVPDLEAMTVFDPTRLGPQFALGQSYSLLGDTERSVRHFETFVQNAKLDPSRETNEFKLTLIEAQALLADGLLSMDLRLAKGTDRPYARRSLEFADLAVAAIPNSVKYRTIRASALVRLRQSKRAKADVRAALKLDPLDENARALASLLEIPKP